MGIRIERRRKNLRKRTIIVLISLVFIIMILSIAVYAYSLLSIINETDISRPDTAQFLDQGIEEYIPLDEVEQKTGGITNVALFGLDRLYNEPCRTDTIMILTIDNDSNKIKLTSLMRDMYVNIPGKWPDRINAAYTYGGPGLAINTINTTFNMDIQYYASINFKGVTRLIDKLGGVDIDIKQGEIEYLNFYINELNDADSESSAPNVVQRGLQHLTGKQALGYMRIRYYGNADFERTERQRSVLTQIIDKIKKTDILKIIDVLSISLPYVETNMPKTGIISLFKTCFQYGNHVEQYRLPIDGTFRYETIKNMSVIVPDIEANSERLHEFIYEKDN